MSKGITQESMLSVLPSVLAQDDGMYGLAQLIGWVTAKYGASVDAPGVFQNIENLDEDLCDMLAKDLKIDWYDYDADVATKRRQLTTNWFVRKKIGTVASVVTTLQDVWPETTVEEWFEYGGEPGYFQVLLSADTAGAINFSKAVRMIDVFKPARAHIEGYPIIRVRCGIVIKTHKSDAILYHVPASGTNPRYATHGDKSHENIVVETEAVSQKYHVPATGKLNAGTYPHYYTHWGVDEEDIIIESEAAGTKYSVPVTGMVTAGTYPDYATHGDVGAGGLDVSGSSVSVGYGVRKCGTSNNSLF